MKDKQLLNLNLSHLLENDSIIPTAWLIDKTEFFYLCVPKTLTD